MVMQEQKWFADKKEAMQFYGYLALLAVMTGQSTCAKAHGLLIQIRHRLYEENVDCSYIKTTYSNIDSKTTLNRTH